MTVPEKPWGLLQSVKSPERGVAIWQAYLDSASVSEIEDLRGLLDAAEEKRAEKFYRERDRARFIVAHGLLRLLLSDALERSAITFMYGPNGKPALADDDDFHFNISHSADWGVFALSRGRRVGIDLESGALLDPQDLPAMGSRIFSKKEIAVWHALDERERASAFLRAWTRKEACLKAAGLRLDDVRMIETGLAITSSPQEIVVPASRGESAIRLRLYDLSVAIPPRPATAATTCALAVEVGLRSSSRIG